MMQRRQFLRRAAATLAGAALGAPLLAAPAAPVSHLLDRSPPVEPIAHDERYLERVRGLHPSAIICDDACQTESWVNAAPRLAVVRS